MIATLTPAPEVVLYDPMTMNYDNLLFAFTNPDTNKHFYDPPKFSSGSAFPLDLTYQVVTRMGLPGIPPGIPVQGVPVSLAVWVWWNVPQIQAAAYKGPLPELTFDPSTALSDATGTGKPVFSVANAGNVTYILTIGPFNIQVPMIVTA